MKSGIRNKTQNASRKLKIGPCYSSRDYQLSSFHDVVLLLQIQEEIVTLKQALDRKEKQLAEIKQLLGITAWTQLRDGFHHQYQNLQGTQM